MHMIVVPSLSALTPDRDLIDGTLTAGLVRHAILWSSDLESEVY